MTVRPKSNIALKPHIISCIISSQEGGKRVNRALYELKPISLEEAYASRTRETQQKKELEELIGPEKWKKHWHCCNRIYQDVHYILLY